MSVDDIFKWLSQHTGLLIVVYWFLGPTLKKILRRRREEPASAKPAGRDQDEEPSSTSRPIPEVEPSTPKELVGIATFRARVLEQRTRAQKLQSTARRYLADDVYSAEQLKEDIRLLERIAAFTEYLKHAEDLKNLRRVFAQVMARLDRIEQLIAEEKK